MKNDFNADLNTILFDNESNAPFGKQCFSCHHYLVCVSCDSGIIENSVVEGKCELGIRGKSSKKSICDKYDKMRVSFESIDKNSTLWSQK